MAYYFLHVKTFSRGKGSSATKAAAYRAGERIRDERSGAVHDYTDRSDVAHAEIVLPSEFDDSPDMGWARQRSVLWNAVQNSGRLWNSRLAREVLVHLPPELGRAQRVALVLGFSHELANRYGCAVDFAVHEPRERADPRHHHAHVLMTTRQVGPQGIGARTTLDLSGTERHARGLGPSRNDLLWIRERWAQVANESLREAGLAVRIDHRSYAAQGIDREPKPMIPQSIVYSERLSGKSNPAGDDIRARYQERVAARAKGGDALKRVIERQRQQGREHALQWAERRQVKKGIPQGAFTREQLKEKNREYRRANAAEINRKARERRHANATEFNRKQRERRAANLDEVRRKDRERYRKRCAAKAALDAARIREQLPAQVKARSLVSTGQKPLSLADSSRQVSAEESVKNWLATREAQVPAPADESLNRWLAYRERQGQAASPDSPSRERSHERDGSGKEAHERGEAGKSPGRKNDLSL